MAEDYEIRLDERVAQLLGLPRGTTITVELLLVALLKIQRQTLLAVDRMATAFETLVNTPHPW